MSFASDSFLSVLVASVLLFLVSALVLLFLTVVLVVLPLTRLLLPAESVKTASLMDQWAQPFLRWWLSGPDC
jgi:succinate dehydrogenase hydrophobic anchor subunit